MTNEHIIEEILHEAAAHGLRTEVVEEAKKLCDVCPVLTQCRTHARTHSEYGFWGGESEEERYTSGYKISNPTFRRRINKLNSSKD